MYLHGCEEHWYYKLRLSCVSIPVDGSHWLNCNNRERFQWVILPFALDCKLPETKHVFLFSRDYMLIQGASPTSRLSNPALPLKLRLETLAVELRCIQRFQELYDPL
jgi:hypothetical protein